MTLTVYPKSPLFDRLLGNSFVILKMSLIEKRSKKTYYEHMKNLITCAFAFKEGYGTSQQLNKSAGKETTEMYLKNLLVALASAKYHNPEDDVFLCVNMDLDEDWKKRFNKSGVEVREMNFNSFVVPKEFPWSLAFFKMCVLNTWVNEGNYDRYLILDADTYTTRSFNDMWKEADLGIMLFPLGHTYSHHDRDVIRRDFAGIYPEESAKLPITHYGGEYVCGTKANLKIFIDKCLEVFDKISAKGFKVEEKIGDEDLWSISATLLGRELPFIAATPYIFRFWTTDIFYLVSTCTVSNPVAIWHMPQEKETGFIRLYDYYMKTKSFPEVEKAAAMFGIQKAKRPFNIYTFSNKVNGKLKKWKIRK